MQIYRFGELVELDQPLTPDDVQAVVDEAHRRKAALQALPLERILDLLERVAAAWADPDYPLRKVALSELPGRIHFGAKMIEQGVLTMVDLLRRENLVKRLDVDLDAAAYLDGWVYHQRFGGFLLAQPLGVVAHVSAGNVFVGGVDSLIQGIVTKNVSLMKMSSVDPLFPVLFARSLRELDGEGVVSASVALLLWPGGDAAIERMIKQGCDGVVVYGGAETVRSYREDLGLHTKLIEYGPKYSFVMVTADALARAGLDAAARRIARDVVMWEQSACSSPHAVYVENAAGATTADDLADALARALAEWARELPPGTITDDEGTEITRVREMARVEQVMGTACLLAPPEGGTEWTVVMQRTPEFQTSCLNRTVFVKPVARLEEAIAAMEPLAGYLQSVAILADLPRAEALGQALTRLGADRFVEIGQMAVRKHGTPHDGTRGLAELVRWTSLAMVPENVPRTNGSAASAPALVRGVESQPLWLPYDPDADAFDFLPDAERDAVSLARLQAIVGYAAAHSPYYAERCAGLRIDTLADLQRLAILTGDELKKHVPPLGRGLLTDPNPHGYVFASGGTTGAPKCVYRTHEEQHYNAMRLGKGLRLAVFDPDDVVANLLFAGNMWASFVSFNMALDYAGCRILPIAGNVEMAAIATYLQQFGPNAGISLPSVLLSVGDYVSQHRIHSIRLRKIATGGEHLFAGAREFLAQTLGVEVFASGGYSANDTGAIGYQCRESSDGVHHLHEDLQVMEILDPATGEPVPEGAIGEIVVTNLQRRLMPTLRYAIGDQGRWLSGPCACGRRTRRFELLGRTDDVLNIGGAAKLVPDVVAAAVHATPGLSEHFQMVARVAGHLDQLVVRVERQPGDETDEATIVRSVLARLDDGSKELRAMSQRREIADVSVEVLPPGGLPRNPRTGKIQLIVDERQLQHG
jgi:phenylacetate-coenzyme A ligase PaaK-like adenylate-forming protein/acyl-CoA reductase-like NAD-dependent aldehyde dehydrogenase